MSTGANKQRSKKIKALGAIPMATAIVTAFGMSSAYAQSSDANSNNGSSGHTDALGRVAIAGSNPDWAKPSTEKGAVPAAQVINTRVFLAGQNQSQLSAMAQAINEPGSADYHKYLTPAQVQADFGSTADQLKTVTDWAQGAGLKVTSTSPDWVDISGSAEVVQAAFGTQLNNYTGPDGQTHYAAASAAMLPAKVAGAITGVNGLFDVPNLVLPGAVASPVKPGAKATSSSDTKVSAPATSTKASTTTPGDDAPTWDTAGCSVYWNEKQAYSLPVPICGYDSQQLRGAYGVASSGLTGKGATVAIVDAYGSPTMASDLATYDSNFGVQQMRPGQYREVENPAAFTDQADCSPAEWAGEQALDVEAVHNMAPDANIVYYAANSCQDNDLMAAEESIVDSHSADVVSVSEDGLQHFADGYTQSQAQRDAYDRIFMKGALEGIGFNFATGDCGDNDPSNAATGGNCQAESAGKQTAWPASSAWATAVGATTLQVGSNDNYISEEAWGDWDSGIVPASGPITEKFAAGGGGGTSTLTPQPFYQRGVVPTSMSQTAPNGQHLAQPMRTTPDVAMDGSSLTAMSTFRTDAANGNKPDWQAVGGTSLATPLFAAEEAMAKEAHGGVAPGFENPTIYANQSKFRDVTSNAPTSLAWAYPNNYIDEFVAGVDTSLKAGPGYDEATGVGSPTLAFIQAPYDANRAGRIAGTDRYQTGIDISQAQWGNGTANAVVLARGDNFPDALAGAPLAKKVGGPLLLTPANASDAQVVAEIHRVLKPGGQVYVLGGTAAITPAVVNGLGLPAKQVTRIGGVDRYDTALKIAQAMGNPSHVVLATGTGFADALSAGPFASTVFSDNGAPAAILLTNDKVMNPAVAAYAHSAKAVAAVGAQAVTAAKNAHIANVEGFAGYDRYDTAAQVAGTFHGEHIAGVATGLSFADALTGAAQLGEAGGPLVLTNVNNLPSYTANALHGIGASLGGAGLIEIFGGPVAISQTTEWAIAGAAGAIAEG